jgi:hypothetical protein
MHQQPFTHFLWIMFVVTGVSTIVIAAGIRLMFRRGKGATDL